MTPLLPLWLYRFIILNKKQKKMNMTKVLGKLKVCNSSNKNDQSSVTFMHMPIVSLCCKFQIIILNTIAETRTVNK